MSSRKNGSTDAYHARRIEILRKAAGIIRRKGFAATRIDDIADAVGLTKAGLYHYIPSKTNLLVALFEHAMARLELEVVEPGRAKADPEARLRTLVNHHTRLILEEQDLVVILTAEFERLSREHRNRFARGQRAFFHLFRGVLDELKAEGQLRDLDPAVAAFSLLGTMLWLPRWFRHKGQLTREQIVENTTRFILAAVLA